MAEPVADGVARGCRWLAEVDVDGGGPVIVADVAAYAHWCGVHADPAIEPLVVAFYGPLVAQLPPRFQPSGADEWHQAIRLPDVDATRAYLAELRAAAEQVVPGLTVREQRPMSAEELAAKAKTALAAQGAGFVEPLPDGNDPEEATQAWLSAWRDHIEQGVDLWGEDGRVLHVGVSHDTDYRRACDELTDDAAAVSFGPDGAHAGVVWDPMGYGRVCVGATDDGFLLLRTWVNDDSYEQLARQHVAAASATDEYDEELEITLLAEPVVVAWSTVRMAEFSGLASVEAITTAANQNEVATVDHAVATAIHVAPGTYRLTSGEYDEADGWSCRWARFTRAG